MDRDICSIKGNRDGLMIIVKDGTEFSRVIAALETQLSSAQSFFAGASAKIILEKGEFDGKQLDQLEKLMERYGMILDREPPATREVVRKERPVRERKPRASYQDDNTLLVRRTIRSGQSLCYDGNVVVMGDVNPGAEVICSGDILVLGSLRGVAHAGAEGKVTATVFAFRLEPTQLRIAHFISRAPDEKIPQPAGPEIARVVDNFIQINMYSH